MNHLVEKAKNICLMGHIIADYPSALEARQMVDVMVQAGVSIIEVQIPFSEPMADGPLFMHANQQALEQGVTVAHSFALMKEIAAKHPQIPFLFMTYANIVYQKGYAQFVSDAKQCGARGVIVPDLSFDTAADLMQACKEEEFAFVSVVPPNISDARLDQICASAQGMIYAVARAGVTGADTSIDRTVTSFLERIRQRTDLPIACGFGIKRAEHVRQLHNFADFAVVGTGALEAYRKNGLSGLKAFWSDLLAEQTSI